MVEHPISMKFGENSCDSKLALDVTEESMPDVPNGVISEKKGQKFVSLTTVDENTTDSSINDLSINSRIIEKRMERREVDSVQVKSMSYDQINRSCDETTSLEKSDNSTDNKTDSFGLHNCISNSSAKVNGFSSKRSSDDDAKDEVNFKKLANTKSSSLRKFFGNGTLYDFLRQSASETTDDESCVGQKSVSEETEKSLIDLPVDSCDKSNNYVTNELRTNGDFKKLLRDQCMCPALCKSKLDADSRDADPRDADPRDADSRDADSSDSDSGSGNSSSCPEKRSKITNSEDSSSCSEKRSRIEDSVVPNGYSDCENSINSVDTNGFQKIKKTTARKSTSRVRKMITNLVEEECSQEQLADAENLVTPVENGVDHSTANFVDVNASSNERRQSPVEDKKYPIVFTRESASKSLKNVFEKNVKRLSRRLLEEIVVQTCCEMISDTSEIRELKNLTAKAEETEILRKKKTTSLDKQVFQLRVACDVFCDHIRQANECSSEIIPPKVITRNVGLQVLLPITSETNLLSTRANSVNEDGQKAPSAVINSRITSSDVGQSFNCSSMTKSPSPSSSKPVNNKKNEKPSLPTNCSPVPSSKSNTILPAKKNSSSETPNKTPPPPPTADDAIVDLTELDDSTDNSPKPTPIAPRNGLSLSRLRLPSEVRVSAKHPAPLPSTPKSHGILGAKAPPPKPSLTLLQPTDLDIKIMWDLPVSLDYEPIKKYQIYAYQEIADVPATVTLWNLVGEVESLNLPMTCTLNHFVIGYTYHFAVRAVDRHGRIGGFSCVRSVTL